MSPPFRKLAFVVIALALICSAAIAGLLTGLRWGWPNRSEIQLSSPGPTISQLEHLQEFATVRIHITDVLCAEGDNLRGSWLIKGDALIGCDLSKARIDVVDTNRKIATVRLPSPHVISARVDHEKTKTWSVEKTTWLPWKGNSESALHDAAMRHAQRLIEAAAESEQQISSARTQTEQIVRKSGLFPEWSIDIRWD